MKDTPFVSIVLPTYNRAHCLNRSISSVLDQSFEDFELIVVNDGSTDNTIEVLEHITDPRVHVYHFATNRGVAAARNKGFDVARGDWIGTLDSDDELLPDVLDTLVTRLKDIPANRKLGTIIGNSIISTDGSLVRCGVTSEGFVQYEDLLSGRVRGAFWGLFSREVLGTSRFDETVAGFESILWLELYKRSATYYVDLPALIYHRGGDDQLSRFRNFVTRSANMVRGYSTMLEKHGADFLKSCPERYGYYLRRKAFFEKMSGRNSQAVSNIVKALRWSKGAIGEWILISLACLLPRWLTYKLVEPVYTRTRV